MMASWYRLVSNKTTDALAPSNNDYDMKIKHSIRLLAQF
jgi:hypothetical protein